jgi:hypothetical protein
VCLRPVGLGDCPAGEVRTMTVVDLGGLPLCHHVLKPSALTIQPRAYLTGEDCGFLRAGRRAKSS